MHNGDRVLWSLLERNKVWCQGCGRSSVVDDKEVVNNNKGRAEPSTTTTESYEAIKTTYGNDEYVYRRAYMDDDVILFVRRREP